MPLPDGSEDVAEAFADAVVNEKWDAIPPLLTAEARERLTPAAAFGWAALGPKLRADWIAATGEAPDEVPERDRPARFEVYEVEDREPPAGHDPEVMVGWAVINFMPAEGGEFEVSYDSFDCYLTIVDHEDGPKVADYVIELVTD